MGLLETLRSYKRQRIQGFGKSIQRKKRYEPCLRKAVLKKLIANSSLLGRGSPGENKGRENENNQRRRISQRLARLRNIFRNRTRPLVDEDDDDDDNDDFDYEPPTRRSRRSRSRRRRAFIVGHPRTPGQSPRSRLRRQEMYDEENANNLNQNQSREWKNWKIVDVNPKTPETPKPVHEVEQPTIPSNTIIIDQISQQPQNNNYSPVSLGSTPSSNNQQAQPLLPGSTVIKIENNRVEENNNSKNESLPGSNVITIENNSQQHSILPNGELPFEKIASEVISLPSSSEPDSSLEILSYKDAPPGVIPLRDIKIERGIKKEPLSPQEQSQQQQQSPGIVPFRQIKIEPGIIKKEPRSSSQEQQGSASSAGSSIQIISNPNNAPGSVNERIVIESSSSNTDSSLERRKRRNGPPVGPGNKRGIQFRRAKVFRPIEKNVVERIEPKRGRDALTTKDRKNKRIVYSNLSRDKQQEDEQLPIPTQKYNKTSSSSNVSSNRATSPTQLLDHEHLIRTTTIPTTKRSPRVLLPRITISQQPRREESPTRSPPTFNVRNHISQWLQQQRQQRQSSSHSSTSTSRTMPGQPSPVDSVLQDGSIITHPATNETISSPGDNEALHTTYHPGPIARSASSTATATKPATRTTIIVPPPAVPGPSNQHEDEPPKKKKRIRSKPIPGHTFYDSKFIKTLPNISPKGRKTLEGLYIPRRKRFLQKYYRDRHIVEPPQMNSPADQGREFNSPPKIPTIDLNDEELADIPNYQTPPQQPQPPQQPSEPKITIQPEPGSGQPKITVQPQPIPTVSTTNHLNQEDSLDQMLDQSLNRFREEARLKAEQRRILDEYCESAKSTADLQELNRNYLQCIAESVNAFYT